MRRPGQREAAAACVVAIDLVGDVDDPDVGNDREDDRLDDTDELVRESVVGEEGDRAVTQGFRQLS